MTIVVFKVSEDPSLKEEMEKEVKIDFFHKKYFSVTLAEYWQSKVFKSDSVPNL